MKSRISLFVVMCCLCGIIRSQGIPIEDGVFSSNAWYIDVTGAGQSTFAAGVVAQLPAIAAAGIEYIRIGGIDPNWVPLYSITSTNVSKNRLEYLIDAIRAAGMQPIIQVGYNPLRSSLAPLGGLSMATQAQMAADLVHHLNYPFVGTYSANPILWWEIANEPDDLRHYNPGTFSSLTYCLEFRTKPSPL